jgi:hypothetical protein
MSNFNWDSFLKRWSQEILNSLGNDQGNLPPDVLESGWLGYPGATDEQIAMAEARLGITLPPSYRDFLQVTNGWRQTTPFIYRIWSVEDIDWFPVRHQDWIDGFLDRWGSSAIETSNAGSPTPSIPDQQYFVYGEEQDCSQIRVEYLHTALEISEKENSAIYLLNPQVITAGGEWEAWFFGDWLPGADRYPSFQLLMQAEYENFLELRETSAQQIIRFPGTSAASSLNSVKAREQVTAPEALEDDTPVIIDSENDTVEEDTLSSIDFENDTVEEEDTPFTIPSDSDVAWDSIATFTIDFQARAIAGRTEHQITAYHQQGNQQATWTGIATDALQDWMQNQLNQVVQSSSTVETPAIEDIQVKIPATLEITQLRTFQPPLAETPVSMNSSNQLLSGFVRSDEPFALEVAFRLVKLSETTLLSEQLTCLAQFYARNLKTGLITHLGDTQSENFSAREELFHSVKLTEASLQPGLYRLQVLARLEGVPVTPGYLEIPVLQVL